MYDYIRSEFEIEMGKPISDTEVDSILRNGFSRKFDNQEVRWLLDLAEEQGFRV